MNDGDEMNAFLREGFERYAAAKEAVTTFEGQIQERLMRVFEAKRDWANASPRRGERGRGKAVHCGLWENVGRPAIWACTYEDNGKSIELGVRWGKHESGRPLLYTTRWDPKFRRMHLDAPAAPVHNSAGDLAIVPDGGFDLETLAMLLLRETDRALGTASM